MAIEEHVWVEIDRDIGTVQIDVRVRPENVMDPERYAPVISKCLVQRAALVDYRIHHSRMDTLAVEFHEDGLGATAVYTWEPKFAPDPRSRL